MGYWLRAHEGERNNCFSKIQLVGQKNIETKHLSLVKARLKFALSWRFSPQVGYNKEPTSSSTNQNAALIIDH